MRVTCANEYAYLFSAYLLTSDFKALKLDMLQPSISSLVTLYFYYSCSQQLKYNFIAIILSIADNSVKYHSQAYFI